MANSSDGERRAMLQRHGIDYKDGITRPVHREVIENQLLAALDDKEKVAIVLDAEDLKMLLAVVRSYPFRTERVKGWLADLEKLQAAAFG